MIFRIVIAGTKDAIWREITKTDELQATMFNMRLHTPALEPGQPLQMRTANAKYTGVVGTIEEVDRPNRFVHTLRFTDGNDPACRITYELKDADGGVEFTLIVDDYEAGSKADKSLRRGGPMIVQTLKSVVETGKAPLSTRALYAVFGLLAPLTPKRMKSEHWPLDNSSVERKS